MRISAYTPGIYNTLPSQKNRSQSMQQNHCAVSPSFQSLAGVAKFTGAIAVLGAMAALINWDTDYQLNKERPGRITTALTERCPKIDAFVMPEQMKMKLNVRDITIIEDAKKACATLRVKYNNAIQPNNLQARQILETTADAITPRIGLGLYTIEKYTPKLHK